MGLTKRLALMVDEKRQFEIDGKNVTVTELRADRILAGLFGVEDRKEELPLFSE